MGDARRPFSYAEWSDAAYRELVSKQDRLEADLHVAEWPRYDYDLERRTLTFSDAHGPHAVAEIQVIGTTSQRDWLWAWANPSLPAASTEDAERVKAFGLEHDLPDLTMPSSAADNPDQLGWEFAAAAVKVVDGLGVYRAPGQQPGALFLLIRSIRLVN
jgi:hypothetical protein